MASLTCPSVDINFMSPNGFQLVLQRAPTAVFFGQEASVPGLALQVLEEPTSLATMKFPSDKLTFETLRFSFMVDETMSNWMEIFTWIRALGKPENYPQYTVENMRWGMPDSGESARNFSDADLIILGSNNMSVRTFHFVDCFPSSLSGMTLASTNNGVEYVKATVDLEYTYYTVT